jgi:hypothetical protein
MRNAIVLVAFISATSVSAQAAFTDFEDLAPNSEFGVGQTIQTRDVQIAIEPFNFLGNPAKTGGTGPKTIRLAPGPGARIILPSRVREISFDYEDGARLRLEVNGVQPPLGPNGVPPSAGFGYLNGTMVGGVEVSALVASADPPVSERGFVKFQGPIDSFVVAGLELLIDNVSVIVPEPCGATWLAIGMASLCRVCRRRAR